MRALWICLLIFSLPCPAAESAGEPRRLNNLVVELANLAGEEARGIQSLKIFLPTDGWVYVSASGAISNSDRILLFWNQNPDARRGLHLSAKNRSGEKQTWLEAGQNVLTIDRAGETDLDSLIIRRVPETSFSKFGATPRVLATGDHDWAFLSEHLLPHVNTVVGYSQPLQTSYIQEWKSRGGRWLVEVPRPPRAALNAASPLIDGLNIDEFWPELSTLGDWTRAFPRFELDQQIRAYIAERPEQMPDFIRAVLNSGNWLIWERYIAEIPPHLDEHARLKRDLSDWARALTNQFPGVMRQSVICIGMFSTPPLSLNRSPEIDFKVWLDMQFQTVATDPVFRALPALMIYQTRNTDEETLRWCGALFRHYAIEGETNLLSQSFNYRLAHVRNPDFTDGAAHWTLQPADNSPQTESITNLAGWQGRYPAHEFFDRALVLREGQGAAQTLRNLKPGQLYSAKAISVKMADLTSARSSPALHAVGLSLAGATILPELTFQQAVAAGGPRRLPFNDENPLWLNCHQVCFRALSTTASLQMRAAQGAEPLAVNFIEVQPYYSK